LTKNPSNEHFAALVMPPLDDDYALARWLTGNGADKLPPALRRRRQQQSRESRLRPMPLHFLTPEGLAQLGKLLYRRQPRSDVDMVSRRNGRRLRGFGGFDGNVIRGAIWYSPPGAQEGQMMVVPVAYDITRLATRVLNLTPNGIDRIDFSFARHFLDPARQEHLAIMTTPFGPRAIGAAAARDVVDGISVHWGEDDKPEQDKSYREIAAFIRGEAAPTSGVRQIAQGRRHRTEGVLRWILRHGLPLGRSPTAALPERARYLNVSQFPLWIAAYFSWLKERPDVKAAFFIHDLLPLQTPEYFRKAEYERHRRRLANLARFGAGAIVTTKAVQAALTRHLAELGRTGMPVLVLPPPAAPVFWRRDLVDPALADMPYFVTCGTIEPRKNHLMLLHVWRELVARDGATAPKLVLIGNRGWETENAVDLLQRCPSIGNHVIEAAGLPTPAVKRLLDGARALLMPSFAEGYGLPVAEALAAGVPVIASDIAVFRETGGGRIIKLSPIDGEGWLNTIRAFSRSNRPERQTLQATRDRDEAMAGANYFATVSDFLEAL
jgi:glycosyltransferase involved in cell wall biosynthesis